MRSKHLLIILLIGFIGGILSLRFVPRESDSIFLRISSIIYDNNKIELSCIGIDKKNVNVVWRSEQNEKMIIRSGKQVGKIGNDYGPNTFEVKIANDKVFKVGNWKTNNWHAHHYKIGLEKDAKGYKIKFIADGINFEHDEKEYDLNGKLDGVYRSYHRNGNISAQATYRNGLTEGQSNYYYENGKIRTTTGYMGGKLNGYSISYTPDGNIESKRRYRNGEEIQDSL